MTKAAREWRLAFSSIISEWRKTNRSKETRKYSVRLWAIEHLTDSRPASGLEPSRRHLWPDQSLGQRASEGSFPAPAGSPRWRQRRSYEVWSSNMLVQAARGYLRNDEDAGRKRRVKRLRCFCLARNGIAISSVSPLQNPARSDRPNRERTAADEVGAPRFEGRKECPVSRRCRLRLGHGLSFEPSGCQLKPPATAGAKVSAPPGIVAGLGETVNFTPACP